MRIHVNKIEKRITFKIKARNFLELLTPETAKLIGSAKGKLTKNGTAEDVPNWKIT